MFTTQTISELFSKYEFKEYVVVGMQLSKKDYDILMNLPDRPAQSGHMWTAQVGILDEVEDGSIKVTAQLQQIYGPRDGEVLEEIAELYKIL